jgi:hypothetical protein
LKGFTGPACRPTSATTCSPAGESTAGQASIKQYYDAPAGLAAHQGNKLWFFGSWRKVTRQYGRHTTTCYQPASYL